MRFTVRKDERALVYKDGNYFKVLGPGKYFKNLFGDYEYFIQNVNDPFKARKNMKLYMEDKELMSELDVIDIRDNEVAIRFEDNRFAGVLVSGRHAFWNVIKENRFVVIDLNKPELPADLDKAIVELILKNNIALMYFVASNEKGLLYFNKKFQRVLDAGKYYFMNGYTDVDVINVDMRQLQLDMAGQEIMTRDKVTLRLNFIVQYRIVDPVKAVENIKDYREQLYILMQLILREYVGTLRLDELMEKKEEAGVYVINKLKSEIDDWGLKFINAGIKDVILPGEMKAILSKVIEAEKQAQANIIMRREETASTRSLLNTAKLMEDNPLLFKLKELEYVEQIANKVSNLSVVGGGQIIDQLKSLFSGLSVEKADDQK